MAHPWDYRFRYTLGDLRECDRVIEELMNEEISMKAGTLLEGYELKSAHELIRLCGTILNRVFSEVKNPQAELCTFVFDGQNELPEEIIEGKNRIQRNVVDAENDELDRIFEEQQARLRGESCE